MGFKTAKAYNEEKYGNAFRLVNNGDFADVIFLYQSDDDVLMANAHYLKTDEYSGYVHCLEKGCPVCAWRGPKDQRIRTQDKLFIPLYNIAADEIQFFERTNKFEPQLIADVFSKYPNPSEFIFRITRHGAAGDRDTRYTVVAIQPNTTLPYATILANKGVTLPDYYNTVCQDVDAFTLQTWLSSEPAMTTATAAAVPYAVTPRGAAAAAPSIDVFPDEIEEDGESDLPEVDFE